MSDEKALREKAREVIRSGILPNRRPDRTWGGLGAGWGVPDPGVDTDCPICGGPVKQDEVEFEIEFAGEDGPSPRTYHVHVRCFAAWELERQSADGINGRGSTGYQAPSPNHARLAGGQSEKD